MSLAKQIIESPERLTALKNLMWRANEIIMQVYRSDDFGTLIKNDNSPVTKADMAAHHILVNGLKQLTPEIPVVSEEDPTSITVPLQHSVYWLIDPLDGTKEFLKRNDQFTCNLALIENHRSCLGFVSVPAENLLYVGGAGLGASTQRLGENPQSINCARISGKTRVVASKSHLNDETRQHINSIEGDIELVQAGSSLKFLTIAAGKADIYPRFSPTSEWDTAAAQAVLEGAGGTVVQQNGEPMRYGKEEILNPYFIARGLSLFHKL